MALQKKSSTFQQDGFFLKRADKKRQQFPKTLFYRKWLNHRAQDAFAIRRKL